MKIFNSGGIGMESGPKIKENVSKEDSGDSDFPENPGEGEMPQKTGQGKPETGTWNCKSCLEIKIEELMTREVVTVHEDALLEEIFILFEKHLYHTLPVLNSEGKLAGVIDQDIVLEILLFTHIPRAKHTHLAAVRSLGIHAKDIMITHPVTISPDSTLLNAADMMMKNRLDRVCITEKGKLLGVISKRDIVREVSRRRALEMG